MMSRTQFVRMPTLLLAASATTVAAQGTPARPAGVTDAAVAKGDSVFHTVGNCYACHGADAKGVIGPNLTDAEWIHGDGSYDAIVATVANGIPADKAKSGVAMPPKGGGTMTDGDVKAVAAYVWSLRGATK